MLSATDPEGRAIYLSQETWDTHIIKRHSDMVPDWIAETLEEPVVITRKTIKQPKYYLELCYYRLNILPPRSYPGQYLKVVVRQRIRKSPFRVITAFPTHYVKQSEEEIVWTRFSRSSFAEPT